MFTTQMVIENPRRASLVQHLIALAAVHGIRTLDGYEDLVSTLSHAMENLKDQSYTAPFVGFKLSNDVPYHSGIQTNDLVVLGVSQFIFILTLNHFKPLSTVCNFVLIEVLNLFQDIRLKWPNDIYFGRKLKLGGVIVKSSFFRNRLTCNIGKTSAKIRR